MENFIEIVNSFVEVVDKENGMTVNSNNNQQDSIKTIFLIIVILCEESNDIADIILNMKILDIISSLLSKEFISSDNKQKLSANLPIFEDLFALIISLFPNPKFSKAEYHVKSQKKESFQIKLFHKKNYNYLVTFSEKIISVLIKNITSMPSTSNIIDVIKITDSFFIYAPKELIVKSVDPYMISNICSSKFS